MFNLCEVLSPSHCIHYTICKGRSQPPLTKIFRFSGFSAFCTKISRIVENFRAKYTGFKSGVPLWNVVDGAPPSNPRYLGSLNTLRHKVSAAPRYLLLPNTFANRGTRYRPVFRITRYPLPANTSVRKVYSSLTIAGDRYFANRGIMSFKFYFFIIIRPIKIISG